MGWRDLSDSDVVNVLASASYRGDNGRLDFTTQHGDSDLRGNGSSPLGLLELDRAAVFTAPDITDNTMTMVNVTGAYEFSDSVSAKRQWNFIAAIRRRRLTVTVRTCSFVSWALAPFCSMSSTSQHSIQLGSMTTMSVAITYSVLMILLTSKEFSPPALAPTGASIDVDDLTGTLSGTGVLADSAINNTSQRKQRSYGGDLQFNFSRTLFGHVNALHAGLRLLPRRSTF